MNRYVDLEPVAKKRLLIEAFAFFPRIVGSGANKFEDVAEYWIQEHQVICANVRDVFSAGGKIQVISRDLGPLMLRSIEAKLYFNANEIMKCIQSSNGLVLAKHWGLKDPVAAEAAIELYCSQLSAASQLTLGDVSAADIFLSAIASSEQK